MTRRITMFALTLLTAGSAFSPACRLPAAWAADPSTAPTVGEIEEPEINKRFLSGRRFKFYWKSHNGGGLNGVATLKSDGSIDGIDSPNESTWVVDDAGRLVFRHADGRVSTRYDKASVTEGVLYFEGPFLLRNGIVHLLVEIGGPPGELTHRIQPKEADGIKYSSQRFVYLDVDETYVFRLKNGTERTIQIKSVEEYKDSVIGLARRAEVVIEVDGKPLTLSCAPYAMPTEVDGLRIQADTTSAWLSIPKRVQFSLWDATDPIVDTALFCFPLPAYRLFSQGMQAYNEPVHLGHRDGDPVGQRFHHNYGVDFAGYEGRQKVVSCIDGVVAQVKPREGTLAIQDDRGFILVYGHLDAILSNVRKGTAVKRGQWVGMLGKKGASGNFSHLHVGTYLSDSAMIVDRMNRNLNLYPWLMTAYEKASDTKLHAVARPHHTVCTGETVVFDGAKSLAGGSEIVSFRWEFHDGTKVNGLRAEKIYQAPGCYMAALWVEDDRGSVDVDFCKVKVFSRSEPEDVIPTLFVTFKPARVVRIGEPVSFRIWPQGEAAENIQVDFGDVKPLQDYRPYSAITHTFRKPGIQIVTVSTVFDEIPVTQKAKVIVQE